VSMRLRCYFPTEEALAFTISVESDANVHIARQHIFQYLKNEEQLPHDVRRSSDLRLYKARLFLLSQVQNVERCRQWIHSQPDTANLAAGFSGFTGLVDVFRGGLPDDMIHIIVAVSVMEICDTLGVPDAPYRRKIRKGLAQRIETASSGPSPSEIVKTAGAVNKFFGGDSPVYLNQVPAQIFSPPLARLQQNLEIFENMEVSSAMIRYASNLLAHLVQFYEDEDVLEAQIIDDISLLLDGHDVWHKQIAKVTKLRPDVSWFYKNYPIGLLELRNTLGIGGDAMYKTIVDHTKIIAAKEVRRNCNLLNCSKSCHFFVSLSLCMEAATFLLSYSLSRGRACKFRPLFLWGRYT
ncbi:hypothetical protein HYPSUDRAFT_1065839, partial [Hypholoma sublateritium FD-334 SS-4]